LVVFTEETCTSLPWEFKTILNLNVGKDGLSWLANKDVRDGDDLGFFHSPSIVFVVAFATEHVLEELADLLTGVVGNVGEREVGTVMATMMATSVLPVASAASPAATTTTASTTSVVSVEGVLIVVDFDVSLSVWHVLIDDGEHSLRALVRLVDLEESVLVVLSLLAHRAVVKILADAALVADSLDRVHAAAIAADVAVDHVEILVGLVLTKLSAVHHTVEDLLTLLVELLLDEFLEALSGKSSHVFLLLATLGTLAFSGNGHLVFRVRTVAGLFFTVSLSGIHCFFDCNLDGG